MTSPERGTAVVTKGEPSAEDVSRLRLALSRQERERLRAIAGELVERAARRSPETANR